MSRKRDVPKRELSLVQGALAIALHDERELPLGNVAKEVGLKVPRVKHILKHRDEYMVDGKRLQLCREHDSREGFIADRILTAVKN